jgi:hypothetical protein
MWHIQVAGIKTKILNSGRNKSTVQDPGMYLDSVLWQEVNKVQTSKNPLIAV